MSRHWKEPYSLAKARQIAMHDMEGCVIIGDYVAGQRTVLAKDGNGQYRHTVEENMLSSLTEGYARQMKKTPINKWIYHVYVCRFTFSFFSLEYIPNYIRYYSTKILPSRILDTPHINHDMRQTLYNRLPMYLRDDSKRPRVVKALRAALADFEKQEAAGTNQNAGVRR